jgi:hypothetical protein
MKKVIILLIIINTICPLWGQLVSFGFGLTYIVDKSKVKLHPDVLGKGVGGNDDWYCQISYVHWLNKKVLISGSYSKYPMSTIFNFHSENGSGGYGLPGATKISRIEAGVVWVPLARTKFILHPMLNIGLQHSTIIYDDIIGTIPSDILPFGFKQLSSINAQTFSNNQIVPILGIKLGYSFWNRLELFLDIRQVWGFITVQELRIQYAYNGVKQPDAITYSDGTGRFWGLGIGYRFLKSKSE